MVTDEAATLTMTDAYRSNAATLPTDAQRRRAARRAKQVRDRLSNAVLSRHHQFAAALVERGVRAWVCQPLEVSARRNGLSRRVRRRGRAIRHVAGYEAVSLHLLKRGVLPLAFSESHTTLRCGLCGNPSAPPSRARKAGCSFCGVFGCRDELAAFALGVFWYSEVGPACNALQQDPERQRRGRKRRRPHADGAGQAGSFAVQIEHGTDAPEQSRAGEDLRALPFPSAPDQPRQKKRKSRVQDRESDVDGVLDLDLDAAPPHARPGHEEQRSLPLVGSSSRRRRAPGPADLSVTSDRVWKRTKTSPRTANSATRGRGAPADQIPGAESEDPDQSQIQDTNPGQQGRRRRHRGARTADLNDGAPELDCDCEPVRKRSRATMPAHVQASQIWPLGSHEVSVREARTLRGRAEAESDAAAAARAAAAAGATASSDAASVRRSRKRHRQHGEREQLEVAAAGAEALASGGTSRDAHAPLQARQGARKRSRGLQLAQRQQSANTVSRSATAADPSSAQTARRLHQDLVIAQLQARTTGAGAHRSRVQVDEEGDAVMQTREGPRHPKSHQEGGRCLVQE